MNGSGQLMFEVEKFPADVHKNKGRESMADLLMPHKSIFFG
jgi:hypothetical protein